MKALLLVMPDELTDQIGRLISSCLTLNGWDLGKPEFIDWPPTKREEDES